jgi:hypothetical protein
MDQSKNANTAKKSLVFSRLKPETALEALLRVIFIISLIGTVFSTVMLVGYLVSSEPPSINVKQNGIEAFVSDEQLLRNSLSDTGIVTKDAADEFITGVILRGVVEDPSSSLILADLLPRILGGIIVCLGSWVLLRILRRSYEGKIFSTPTVKDIRILTVLTTVFLVGSALVQQLQIAVLVNRGFYNDFREISYNIDLKPVIGGFVLFFVGILAAKTMQEALRLKEENDGTI